MRDAWNDTWSAGISVEFALWNWGKKRLDYQAVHNDLLKAQIDFQNMQSQIELDIKRISLEIHESMKRYEVSMKMTDQAEENYRISKDKYRNGMLLNSDLLDAEVDLLRSKLEITKSIMDYNTKIAELKRTAGMYGE